MKIGGSIAAGSLILALGATFGGQSGDRNLAGLIAAERGFAAMSRERGVREAFLANLADDAVVFRPKPMPGRQAYEEMPAGSPIILTWSPAYAEVSVRGDLGYTTGPYEVRDRTKPADPARFGHYVSVWERQADGQWKVSLDAGIRHTGPGRPPSSVATVPASFRGWRGPRIDRDTERAALLEVEAAFAQKARTEGLTEAYLLYAGDDVRLYRDQALPRIGKAALLKLVSGDSRRFTWGPVDAVVSSVGDLGYVFGEAEAMGGDPGVPFESSSYLRIWRKTAGGLWRIALDLAVPVPAAAEPNSADHEGDE
jgi:ketosteroid isomerase-like protein